MVVRRHRPAAAQPPGRRRIEACARALDAPVLQTIQLLKGQRSSCQHQLRGHAFRTKPVVAGTSNESPTEHQGLELVCHAGLMPKLAHLITSICCTRHAPPTARPTA